MDGRGGGRGGGKPQYHGGQPRGGYGGGQRGGQAHPQAGRGRGQGWQGGPQAGAGGGQGGRGGYSQGGPSGGPGGNRGGGYGAPRGGGRGGQGGPPSDRGGFNRGRGNFRGGSSRGGSQHGGPKEEVIFESGNVPVPDSSIEAWENKLAKEVNDENQLTSAVTHGIQRLSLTDQIALPRRPGYGTQGRKIIVRVNYFPLEIFEQDIDLYRYEISILPKTGTGDTEDAETKSMAKARRLQLISLLMKQPAFYGVRWATDYAKLIITDTALPDLPVFNITYHDPDSDPLPNFAPGEHRELTQKRQRQTRKIRVTRAGELSRLSVRDLLQAVASGRQTDYYAGRDEMIQAYNIIINSAVLRAPQNPRVAHIGQNKFYPFDKSDPLTRSESLQEGLEALRGYFSSLRIGANRLLLNVNVTSGAFYKAQLLSKTIVDYARDDRTQNMLARLSVLVKNLRVRTDYMRDNGRPVTQVHTITGIAMMPRSHNQLGGTAKNVSFTTNDNGQERTNTVEQYFKRKYNLSLKFPGEVLVTYGSSDQAKYLPAELCTVIAGHPFRRLLPPSSTSEMIKFAARKPASNALSITTDGLQLLKVKNEDARQSTHEQWGIRIKGQMITVQARILPPPRLIFQNDEPRLNKGMWNFGDVRFTRGTKIPSWTVLFVRPSKLPKSLEWTSDDVLGYANRLKTAVRRYGVSLPDCGQPRLVVIEDMSSKGRAEIDSKIREEFDAIKALDPKPSLVWVIIPTKDVYLKARIKLYGDTVAGVQTMLIQQKTLESKSINDVNANIAAKLNLRFGGLCWQLDANALRPLNVNKTMLIGIDVSHPSPGSAEGTPSVAAIVATIHPYLAQYRGRVRAQASKKEMVTELKILVLELLSLWRKHNGNHLPETILVYRDGVSEGQYQDVLRYEVTALEQAFLELYGQQQYWPKLSVVVVTKRHHVRFFPTSNKDTDGSTSNCAPGTVVDRGITGGGSQFWETYLQAHRGIQGHARSARYIVLRHGIKQMGVDDFERITHALSYMWQRAPRSVSYAPPAYYADLLAERGRGYLIKYFNDPEGKAKYDPNTVEWNNSIHDDVKDTMFFV